MIPFWFRLREVMPSDPRDPLNAMEVNQLHRALTSLSMLPDTYQRIEERFAMALPPYDPHNASVIQYRALNPGPHHSNIAGADHLSSLSHAASHPRGPAASVMNLEQDQDDSIASIPCARHSRQRTLEWLAQLARDPPENAQVLPQGLLSASPPRPLPEMNLDENGMSEDGNEGDDEYEEGEDEDDDDDENENEDEEDDDDDDDDDESQARNDRVNALDEPRTASDPCRRSSRMAQLRPALQTPSSVRRITGRGRRGTKRDRDWNGNGGARPKKPKKITKSDGWPSLLSSSLRRSSRLAGAASTGG